MCQRKTWQVISSEFPLRRRRAALQSRTRTGLREHLSSLMWSQDANSNGVWGGEKGSRWGRGDISRWGQGSRGLNHKETWHLECHGLMGRLHSGEAATKTLSRKNLMGRIEKHQKIFLKWKKTCVNMRTKNSHSNTVPRLKTRPIILTLHESRRFQWPFVLR